MCNCHKQSCCSSSCHCGCMEKSGNCGSSSCESHCHDEHSSGDFGKEFLLLADDAWMEVLKDKIKEYIIKNDKKIDELAQVIAEANHERWKRKMEKEHCCETYQEKLAGVFGSCGSGSCQSKK